MLFGTVAKLHESFNICSVSTMLTIVRKEKHSLHLTPTRKDNFLSFGTLV